MLGGPGLHSIFLVNWTFSWTFGQGETSPIYSRIICGHPSLGASWSTLVVLRIKFGLAHSKQSPSSKPFNHLLLLKHIFCLFCTTQFVLLGYYWLTVILDGSFLAVLRGQYALAKINLRLSICKPTPCLLCCLSCSKNIFNWVKAYFYKYVRNNTITF